MMQLWLQESRFDRLRMISLKERIRGQLKTNFRSILTRSRVPPSEEHSEADVQLVLDFLQAFESPHLKPEQAVEKKPRTQSFEELYSLGRKIGEGAHAVVKECIEKESGVKLAVKILRSGDEEIVSNFKQTYRMAMEFKHPNLSSMRHLFIDPEREVCHLVMELVPYPSLREHLQHSASFNESCARSVIKQLLHALDYMHNKSKVAHRDIKPENLMYDFKTGTLKLIDFGICKRIAKKEGMCTVTGSLFYKAPEMFAGSYNEKVDLWAVGVLVYELLVGEVPFRSEYTYDAIQKICQEEPDYSRLQFHSKLARDFISRLLTKTVAKRLSAKEALRAPWILADLSPQPFVSVSRRHTVCYDVQFDSEAVPMRSPIIKLLKEDQCIQKLTLQPSNF